MKLEHRMAACKQKITTSVYGGCVLDDFNQTLRINEGATVQLGGGCTRHQSRVLGLRLGLGLLQEGGV